METLGRQMRYPCPTNKYIRFRAIQNGRGQNTVNQVYFNKNFCRSSHCGALEMNLTRNHEVLGSIPGLAQWVKDLALLWLWCRPAPIAPI